MEFLAHSSTPHLEKALKAAAQYGHPEVVQTLLDTGTITELNSALTAAAGNGSVPCLELLIEAGADDLNQAMLQAARKQKQAEAKAIKTS